MRSVRRNSGAVSHESVGGRSVPAFLSSRDASGPQTKEKMILRAEQEKGIRVVCEYSVCVKCVRKKNVVIYPHIFSTFTKPDLFLLF